MNTTYKIKKAIIFAEKKHYGQKDDSGEKYFDSHCKVVGEVVAKYTDDEDVIAAAYMHDTIEDTDTTYPELVENFGQRVADLVMEVTQEGQKDNYGYYFPRLHSTEGILIKFCDRASNLSRMKPWSEDRRKQYLKRSVFWKNGEDK